MQKGLYLLKDEIQNLTVAAAGGHDGSRRVAD
jgi:hypothetical protein